MKEIARFVGVGFAIVVIVIVCLIGIFTPIEVGGEMVQTPGQHGLCWIIGGLIAIGIIIHLTEDDEPKK